METRNVNINISEMNYNKMLDLIKNETLVNMTMSRASIVDIALTNLFKDLKNGMLNEYAIQHLQEVIKYEERVYKR